MTDIFIDKLFDLIVALIQGVVLALFVFYAIDKNAKKLAISQNQGRFGIKDFLDRGKLSRSEEKLLFGKAVKIRLCFANGYNFFNEYFKEMEFALKRGAVIHILLATPNSDFVKEIDIIEKRIENGRETVGHNLDEVLALLTNFQNYEGFKVRHFNTMYRYSIMLGTFESGSIKAWFNVFLPPKLAIESKMFYAEGNNDDANIVTNFDEYFETVWHDDDLSKEAIYKESNIS